MSAPPGVTAGRRWSGNLWLLGLVGVSAVLAGYWLPSRLSSGETSAAAPAARAEEKPARPGSEPTPAESAPAVRRQNDTPFSTPSPWPDATEVYAPLGRVALATAVVLVLLVIFLVLMRRVWTNRTLAGHANVSWQILGELAIGSRNRLLLVQIGREQVLVAVDTRGISGLVLLPMRFADWLDESVDATAENNSRPGRKAAIAAMVGEGDR